MKNKISIGPLSAILTSIYEIWTPPQELYLSPSYKKGDEIRYSLVQYDNFYMRKLPAEIEKSRLDALKEVLVYLLNNDKVDYEELLTNLCGYSEATINESKNTLLIIWEHYFPLEKYERVDNVEEEIEIIDLLERQIKIPVRKI